MIRGEFCGSARGARKVSAWPHVGLCSVSGLGVAPTMKTAFLSFPLALALFLAGCSSAYYSTMEKFGFAKRDILVDRVEDTQKSQEKAKEQFADALEHFVAVTKVDGGDL